MSQTGKMINLNIIKDVFKKQTPKGLSSYKSRYKALTMNDYSKLFPLYHKTSRLSTIRPKGYITYTKTLKNHSLNSLKLDNGQSYLASANSVGGLRIFRRSVIPLRKIILANQENEKLKSGSWLYNTLTGKFC